MKDDKLKLSINFDSRQTEHDLIMRQLNGNHSPQTFQEAASTADFENDPIDPRKRLTASATAPAALRNRSLVYHFLKHFDHILAGRRFGSKETRWQKCVESNCD